MAGKSVQKPVHWKGLLPEICCIAAGLLAFALACLLQPGSGEVRSVTRDGYGRRTDTRKLLVEGLTPEACEMEIPVSRRRYGDEEIEAAREAFLEELPEKILGENDSLSRIRTDLILPESDRAYGFRLRWYSSAPELLDSSGKVTNAGLPEPADAVLEVIISDADHEAAYSMPVRILPAEESEEEALRRRFSEHLQQLDEAGITEAGYTLPETFEGRSLHYRTETGGRPHALWILGLAAAVLLRLRDRETAARAEKERERKMQADYPEIVSRLMIFTGAGLSVRSAWEQIAEDYRKKGGPARPAYEEICRAVSRLQTGVSESTVYRDLGNSSRHRQYRKLAGLLEQHRRSGLSDLQAMLELETREAWEERKNAARRRGEELQTRLLLPLVMMLGIVLVMVMTPAMMNL